MVSLIQSIETLLLPPSEMTKKNRIEENKCVECINIYHVYLIHNFLVVICAGKRKTKPMLSHMLDKFHI